MDRQENATVVQLKFQVDLKELVSGTYVESHQSPVIGISKEAKTEEYFSNSVQKVRVQEVPLTIQSLKTQDTTATSKVTYHNLRSITGTFPTPATVLSRPNCGGLPKCHSELRYLEVDFDRVVWDSEAHGIKTTYKMIYSPDIPTYVHDWSNQDEVYFTNLYKTCAQVFVPVSQGGQSQTVPVLQCAEIRDFQFGSPTTPTTTTSTTSTTLHP